MTEDECRDLIQDLKDAGITDIKGWLQRAEEFVTKWERVGPVEDNTWKRRE